MPCSQGASDPEEITPSVQVICLTVREAQQHLVTACCKFAFVNLVGDGAPEKASSRISASCKRMGIGAAEGGKRRHRGPD